MPKNNETETEYIKNAVIDAAASPENVASRFSNSDTYQNTKASAARYNRLSLVLVFVLIAVTALTIFGLNIELMSNYRDELIMASLVVNGMCVLIFIADMFGWLGQASKVAIDNLLGEQSGELLAFFNDFMMQQVRPSIEEELLLRSVWGEPNEVMVKSQINDKTLNRRSIVIGGLWRKNDLADEDVTVLVNLMFNKNYSKLTVKNFSLNQRTLSASDRIGDETNGK